LNQGDGFVADAVEDHSTPGCEFFFGEIGLVPMLVLRLRGSDGQEQACDDVQAYSVKHCHDYFLES
jgi:hypothetical protein